MFITDTDIVRQCISRKSLFQERKNANRVFDTEYLTWQLKQIWYSLTVPNVRML